MANIKQNHVTIMWHCQLANKTGYQNIAINRKYS